MISVKHFSETTINPDPFIQFDIWFKERLNSGVAIPNTVSLGTASTDGRISVRTVLLKGFNENGFVFFTNYNSKKGHQLFSNNRAALLFYWPETDRQVRIEGVVERVSTEESDNYFQTRPRESQLAAWASEQSTVIPDRNWLENKYQLYETRFKGKPVQLPPHWGGFRIIPDWFEFWQSGDFRLHDRLIYSKKQDSWIRERLAP